MTSPPPAPGEDPASQRQRWRQALAERGRASRGGRAVRYRQRRAGLGAVDGPGRVRVVLPDASPRGLRDASPVAVADASPGPARDASRPATVERDGSAAADHAL